MSFRLAGSVAVTVHGTEPPSQAEWNAYLQSLQRIPNLAQTRSFVFSLGGGPNPKQRAELTRVLESASPLSAIVTASAVMRTIGTAIGWFNRNLRVFDVEQLDAAIAHLRLDADDERTLRRLLIEVAADAGVKLPSVRAKAAQ